MITQQMSYAPAATSELGEHKFMGNALHNFKSTQASHVRKGKQVHVQSISSHLASLASDGQVLGQGTSESLWTLQTGCAACGICVKSLSAGDTRSEASSGSKCSKRTSQWVVDAIRTIAAYRTQTFKMTRLF